MYFVYTNNIPKGAKDIVSLTPESDFFLKKNNISHKSILDFNLKPLPVRENYTNARKIIQSWGQTKLKKKSLKEALTIEGISLWDIIEYEMQEVHFEVIFNYLRIILTILKKAKPKKVFIDDVKKITFVHRDANYIPRIVQTVCHHLKIPCTTHIQGNWKPKIQKGFYHISTLAKKYRNHERKTLQNFKKKQKNVLIFLYGLGMNKTIPIQKSLIKKGINAITICSEGITSTTVHKELNNLPYAYVESFSSKNLKDKTRKETKKLQSIKQQIKKIKFPNQNINMNPVIYSYLDYLFDHQFPEIIANILLIKKILKELSPDLILQVNDMVAFGKTTVLLGNQQNIPSMLIQHGKNLDLPSLLHPDSDIVASWESIQKNDLSQNQNSNKNQNQPNRYIATGSPKEEMIQNEMKDISKNTLKEKLNLPKKKLILFATRYPVYRDFQRIQDLLKVIPKSMHLMVKIHPSDSTYTVKQVKTLFPKATVLKKQKFNHLLAIADAVVSTEECTTCLDTIMAKKPLAVFDYEDSFNQDYGEPYNYGNNPPFLKIKNKEELQSSLNEIIKNKNKYMKKIDQFKEKSLNLNDNSTNNIVKVILKKISAKQ